MSKNSIYEYLQILLAIFLSSVGLKAFLLPNGFLDGGVTGIAILLSKVFSLEIAWILPLASLPFFILGYITVSKTILIKSTLAIIGLSLMIYFENFQAITEDKLIIAVFGGLLLGVGIGMAIRNGAVLDGSEILGIYLHDEFGLSIGNVILFFNVILFAITAVLLTPEIAMYSTLTYFVTSKAIDFTIQGFENYVGLMIIANKSSALQEAILSEIGQGMTIYQGARGYGKKGVKDKLDVIHIIINRIDVKRINKLIDRIDDKAFVIEFDVNHVKGGVIRKLLARKSPI